MVRSQIGNLTFDRSFGHKLCFRYPNEQCEPILNIYVSRAFQWYRERHRPLCFNPSNCFIKFQNSTRIPSPKVGIALGVWGFTPSHLPTLLGVCDVKASSWPSTFQPLCLGHKPKARVATHTKTILWQFVGGPCCNAFQFPNEWCSCIP
jgi:hypothetical protein